MWLKWFYAFSRFTYASWKKQSGLVLTNCTNDGYCSIESDGNYKYSSDKNGIHVTISSLSITEKVEWKCTYLKESQSYNISLGTFSWTSLPKINATLGQETNISFGYESQKIMSRKSLYKEKCNSNNCVSSLIGTFWNGKLTTGELYQPHMKIAPSENMVCLILERVNFSDSGIYTCIVEHKEHHRIAVPLTVHEYRDNDIINTSLFESDDDDKKRVTSFVVPTLVAVSAVAFAVICGCILGKIIHLRKLKNNCATNGNDLQNNCQEVMKSEMQSLQDHQNEVPYIPPQKEKKEIDLFLKENPGNQVKNCY